MTNETTPSQRPVSTASKNNLHVVWHWAIAIAVVSVILWVGTLLG